MTTGEYVLMALGVTVCFAVQTLSAFMLGWISRGRRDASSRVQRGEGP